MAFDIYATGIYRAVEKAGGVSHLAAALGVTRQGVYPWVTRGYAPSERAIQIEKLFGIPRATLMNPKLAQTLTGTANKVAKAGRVRYESRPKPHAESADDLV